MKAEIISIGTELLLGEVTDTNASYLASQLPPLGIDLFWMSTVGDNQARMIEALSRAWQRADLILTTSGLGPTQDDITREAIASVVDEELRINSDLEQELRDLFARRGMEMPASNIRQAALIPSAQSLANLRGTAPGWWVEKDGRIIIAMPGPPDEVQLMWEREAFPRLSQRVRGIVILSRTLKTFGLAESSVDEMLSSLLPSSNPTLATYIKLDGVHLRITAKAEEHEAAQQMLADREASIRAILGDYIWGVDTDTLESVAGTLLTRKGLSLATMESCTGGLLAATLSNIPGSSAYFKGGVVAYTNEVKVTLGVDAQLIAQHGAVSPEVAEAMAATARWRLGADIGIGLTGVAGPTELEGKPAGTIFIGIDNGRRKWGIAGNHPGHRLRVRQRAAAAVLFELRKTLLEDSTGKP